MKVERFTSIQNDTVSRNENLECVAEYAGRMAHDFNNTLQILLSGVQFVLDDEQSNFSYESRIILNKVVEKLRSQSDRLGHIRDFSGVRPKFAKTSTDRVDLSEVTAQTLEKFSIQITRAGRCQDTFVDLERKLCPICQVQAAVGSMETIILNLLNNAYESMPEGGVITVTTMVTRDCGLLEICDRGCGIDERDMVRIFEPYWTTKKNKNRGLGLSEVYGLVKALNGSVFTKSKLGQGTTMMIALPLASSTNT